MSYLPETCFTWISDSILRTAQGCYCPQLTDGEAEAQRACMRLALWVSAFMGHQCLSNQAVWPQSPGSLPQGVPLPQPASGDSRICMHVLGHPSHHTGELIEMQILVPQI